MTRTALLWARGARWFLLALLATATLRMVAVSLAAVVGHGQLWGPVVRAWAGSMGVSTLAVLLAAPLALPLALLLVHRGQGREVGLLRSLVRGLHEVPAVVHGIAGWVLFGRGLGLGASWTTVVLTLSLVTLPTIASMAEWALRRSSSSERRLAAMALGASRFQTTVYLELRAARRGLVWVLLRGWARAFGATVPLLLVAPPPSALGRDWLLPVLAVEQLAAGHLDQAALSATVMAATVAVAFVMTSWAQGRAVLEGA